MRLWPHRRARVPSVLAATPGPFNPMNGHVFHCACVRCALFWDTSFGQYVYHEWHTVAKRWEREERRTLNAH